MNVRCLNDLGYGSTINAKVSDPELSKVVNKVNNYLVTLRFVTLNSIVCNRFISALRMGLDKICKMESTVESEYYKCYIQDLIQQLNPNEYAHNDRFNVREFLYQTDQNRRYIEKLTDGKKIDYAIRKMELLGYFFNQQDNQYYLKLLSYVKGLSETANQSPSQIPKREYPEQTDSKTIEKEIDSMAIPIELNTDNITGVITPDVSEIPNDPRALPW